MASKFIIVVVFTILIQSHCAQQLQSTIYGLSEEKTSQFYRIVENQKTTFSTVFDAINPIFDALEILAAKRRYENLENASFNYSTFIDGALAKAKTAADQRLSSIPVILGKSCPAVDEARTAIYRALDNVYAQFHDAIGLAESGNYTDIRNEFEPFISASNASLEIFIGKFSEAFRTCMNTTTDVIRVHEIGSRTNVFYTSDAIYDAIKAFASRVFTTPSIEGIVTDINYYRRKAIFGVEKEVENTFSPHRGFYLSTQLNQPGIAADLTADQHVQFVLESTTNKAIEVLFGVMKGYLIKVQLGLSTGCHDDSTAYAFDATKDKTAEYFKIGLILLANTISKTKSTAEVAAAANLFKVFSDGATDAYFRALRFARGVENSSYSETVNEIQAIKSLLKTAFPEYVRTIHSLVRLGTNIDYAATTLQNKLLVSTDKFVDNIFEGINVVAEACYGHKAVSEDDFVSLQNKADQIGSLVQSFFSDLSSAHITAVKSLAISTATAISLQNLQFGLGSIHG